MKASLLLTAALLLTACVTKPQNPNVAKRPVATNKFLSEKSDYYLEKKPQMAQKAEARAEVKPAESLPSKPLEKEVAKLEEKIDANENLPSTASAMPDDDRLPEPGDYERSDYPSDKHYKRPRSGFTGFEYHEDNDEQYDSSEGAKPEEEETPLYDEEGLASWYGPRFHGRLTANGEKFNQNAMTAAHRKFPLGSKVEVTNLDNGKSVIVRINDRGPYSGKRIIDLSKAAAAELDMLHDGVAKVGIKQVDE